MLVSVGIALITGIATLLGSPRGFCAEPASTTADTAAPESTAPVIALEETDPSRLVYIEHSGTYWTVGPRLAQVRDYMIEHNLTGPMFVRFHTNPLSTPANSLTGEVGFILTEEDGSRHEPTPPFKAGLRDRELIARRILGPRSTTRRRDYVAMFDWIRAHGHRAAGPVAEIFHSNRSGTGQDTQQTELQFTLEPVSTPDNELLSRIDEEPSHKDPEPVNKEPTHSATQPGHIAEEPSCVDPRTSRIAAVPSRTGKVPSHDDSRVSRHGARPTHQGSNLLEIVELLDAQERALSSVGNEPSDGDRPVSDGRSEPSHLNVSNSEPLPQTVTGTHATVNGTQSEAGTHEPEIVSPPSNVSVPPSASGTRAVADLMLAGEFDRIAEQLMPDDCAIRSSFQVWFGQAVFRLGAAAKGIEKHYPEQQKLIVGTVSAITHRYKVVSSRFELDPMSHAMVQIDNRANPVAAQRRAIMRDLDRLLGLIAFRSLAPDDLLSEFSGSLQRVHDLIRAHGCGTPLVPGQEK